MSLVIVTNRCFLKCESITYITLQEASPEDIDEHSKSSYRKPEAKKSRSFFGNFRRVAPQKQNLPTKYRITIAYIRENISNEDAIDINVTGKTEAFEAYNEIVKEIREQTPDAFYLDTLVDRLLNNKSSPATGPKLEEV